MSERELVICGADCRIVEVGGRRVQSCHYEPDPSAPSVSEVVDCLRDFRGDLSSAQRGLASEQAMRGSLPEDKRRTEMEIKTDQDRVRVRLDRLDALIARLEGENAKS